MSDSIAVNGMLWGGTDLLTSPVQYDDFVKTLIEALGEDKENFQDDAYNMVMGRATRAVYEFHAPDLNDPLDVKWTVLLPPESDETREILDALDPLVKHRKGQVTFLPSADFKEQEDWIYREYCQMDDSDRPHFVLLVGGPQAIPFRFQYLLDVNGTVGRLPFENVEDYATYARKVVEFETKEELKVDKRAVLFATEHGFKDPTFVSRHYMTDPLVDRLQSNGIPVSYLAGDQATLSDLLALLRGDGDSRAPALVYTASHGLGVPGTDEDTRRRLQGALCCQDYDGKGQGLFSAECVPDEPFLHGSIVVTFACYGAGTPHESEFFHWNKDPRMLECRPTADFVAALPLKLLSHPRGPLAFFGHVDPSFVRVFADRTRYDKYLGWGSRMSPFRQAVDLLLEGATIGYAVTKFNRVYADHNSRLAALEDQFRRDRLRGEKPEWTGNLVDIWLTRNDTQNFIVLGDPAVYAKMT